MKEVTKDEFYKVIGPHDVTLNTISPFPYTTEFKLLNGSLVCKVVSTFTDAEKKLYPIITKHYLKENIYFNR